MGAGQGVGYLSLFIPGTNGGCEESGNELHLAQDSI